MNTIDYNEFGKYCIIHKNKGSYHIALIRDICPEIQKQLCILLVQRIVTENDVQSIKVAIVKSNFPQSSCFFKNLGFQTKKIEKIGNNLTLEHMKIDSADFSKSVTKNYFLSRL